MKYESFEFLSNNFSELITLTHSKPAFNQMLSIILYNPDIDNFCKECLIIKSHLKSLYQDPHLILDEADAQNHRTVVSLKSISFNINRKNIELRTFEGMINKIQDNDFFVDTLVLFAISASKNTLKSITGIGSQELKRWKDDPSLVNVSKVEVYNKIRDFVVIT